MKKIEETLTKLHGMMNDKLVGLVYDETEGTDLVLVFEKHTIEIGGKYRIDVSKRKNHVDDPD